MREKEFGVERWIFFTWETEGDDESKAEVSKIGVLVVVVVVVII